MDKYVSRDDVRRFIADAFSENRFATNYDYAILFDEIDELPVADVQPVSQWISIDDRLPEADYDCFVWYSCDTAFGKSKSWGIAHCSRCDWHTKHLDGDNIVVLYWMPCPEPPKDGDTNG